MAKKNDNENASPTDELLKAVGAIPAIDADPVSCENTIQPDPEDYECPEGYPPDDWAAKSIGDKRTYLAAIKKSKKIGDE